jgi:hypothetical protein
MKCRLSATSIAHSDDSNTMRVQSKVADLKMNLMGEVLIDVMQQLVPLSN